MLLRRLLSARAIRGCRYIAERRNNEDEVSREPSVAVATTTAPTPTTQSIIENVKAIERVLPTADELRQLQDDDQLREVFGSGLVKNVRNKVSIFRPEIAANEFAHLKISLEEMQNEHDTTSRAPNRFRSILYDEGELDASDLTQPASPYAFRFSKAANTHKVF